MFWLDRELEKLISGWRKRTSEEVIRVALLRAARRMQGGDNKPPPPSRPDPNALFKLPKPRGLRDRDGGV